MMGKLMYAVIPFCFFMLAALMLLLLPSAVTYLSVMTSLAKDISTNLYLVMVVLICAVGVYASGTAVLKK
jgi:hypothetical protein